MVNSVLRLEAFNSSSCLAGRGLLALITEGDNRAQGLRHSIASRIDLDARIEYTAVQLLEIEAGSEASACRHQQIDSQV